MKRLAVIALCGCSQIFGLHSPDHGTVIDGATIDSPRPDAKTGCKTQADCPTSVCLPGGTCAYDSDVAWLDPTGISNMTCSMTAPCPKLNDALNTQRPYIRVHGAIIGLTNINRDVSIFGEPGASIGQPSYNLNINSGTVGIYDLTFQMSCINAASAMPLTLVDVTITGCSGVAVVANGPLIADRCTITGNRSGGVRVMANAPKFTLTNNVIVNNNIQSTNDTGGVYIVATSIDPTSRLDFNTIVDNNTKNTTMTAGGVWCNAAGFTANSNIIAHNSVQGSTTSASSNTGGGCTFANSIIETDDTNLVLTTGTYRLGAGSVAIDAAMTPPITDHDVDGDTRPQGLGYDIGADEYP